MQQKKCHEKCQNNGVDPHIAIRCAIPEYWSKVHGQWYENHAYLLGPIAFLFAATDDILGGMVDTKTRQKFDDVKDRFDDSE